MTQTNELKPAPDRIAGAGILVVDDEQANVAYLQRLLAREGFTAVSGVTSGAAALESFSAHRPDLVLLDLHMSPADGMSVLHDMRKTSAAEGYLPIVFLSGDLSAPARQAAIAAGATDFLTKPFDPVEVVLRIRGVLLTRLLYVDLQAQNDELEHRVTMRTKELEESRLEIFERLCRVSAYRDDATSEHTKRVGRMTEQLARVAGESTERATLMGMAAELHDIGKVGVPDSILYKPGKLTDEEMDTMRTHATIGADALSGSRSTLLQLAEQIAREHHERWDGSGYPHGLAGEGISLAARIVAVVDVVDALANDRPYRRAWTMNQVLEEVARCTGSHFDPAIVAVMGEMIEQHFAACAPAP